MYNDDFYKVRKTQTTLIIEPDAVCQMHPPGNYLIFGSSMTKNNQFQIVAVDQPRATEHFWQSIFMFDNIRMVDCYELPMVGEILDDRRTFISYIFEKTGL